MLLSRFYFDVYFGIMLLFYFILM